MYTQCDITLLQSSNICAYPKKNHGYHHVRTHHLLTPHSPHFAYNTACYMLQCLRLDKHFFGLRWYLEEIALLIGFITSSKLDNFLGFAAYVTKNTVTMVTFAVMYDSTTPGV
jgi:hypothetical protein